MCATIRKRSRIQLVEASRLPDILTIFLTNFDVGITQHVLFRE